MPPLDVSMVATGYTARRAIVDNTTCSTCHVSLGVGPDFHAGQRNDAKTCNWCHRPTQTSQRLVGQPEGLHPRHPRRGRADQQLHVARGVAHRRLLEDDLSGRPQRLPDVPPAGDVRLQLDRRRRRLPQHAGQHRRAGDLRGRQRARPLRHRGDELRRRVQLQRPHRRDDQPPIRPPWSTSPFVAACVSCHDSAIAVDHMQTNGGSFYEPRSTAFTKPQQEECLLCHGPGARRVNLHPARLHALSGAGSRNVSRCRFGQDAFDRVHLDGLREVDVEPSF